MDKEDFLKSYLKEIGKQLPCSSKKKKRFMQEMTSNIEAFLLQNPEANLSEIRDTFGEPEIIYTSYIQTLDYDFIKRKMTKAKYIKLSATLLIIIILFYFTYIFIGRITNKPTEIIEQITIEETVSD